MDLKKVRFNARISLLDLTCVCERRLPCTAKAVQRNLAEGASGTQGAAPFLLRNGTCSVACKALKLLTCICICN